MYWHLDIRLGIIVVTLALIQGGRYERLVALVFGVRGALNLLAPHWDWKNIYDWERLIAFQSVFLVILAMIAWRHRAGWLIAIVVMQICTVGLEIATGIRHQEGDPLAPGFYVLAIGKSLALGWAVARRWIGPPRPLPAPGAPDPDLYEEAMRRKRPVV